MTPSRSSGSIRSRLGVAVHPRRGRATRSGARHDPSAWAQSGMRAGEVCGLQWGDLGLDRGEALVQRTRSRRASARRRRGGRGWSHSSTRSRTTLPNGAQGPQRPARRALGGAAGVQGAESCSGDVRVRFRSAPAGFDGAPPGAASRADGREGALQGRGAPQAHVGQRDALAQRPPALRPAAGRLAERQCLASRERSLDAAGWRDESFGHNHPQRGRCCSCSGTSHLTRKGVPENSARRGRSA
jgi:integrase